MPRRVLFLMSDTGGGHRASANAIGEALHRLHGPAVTWRLVDLLVDYGHWPLHRAPDLYDPLVHRYLWLWKLLWRAGEQPRLWSAVSAAMLAWNWQRLARCFAENPADLVVSVHPLLNHAPLAALRRLQPGTPFATVVTDLATAHPVWYNRAVDLLCASCPEVRQAALAAGIAAQRVRLLGLPIGLDFGRPTPDRSALRRRLGLADRPMALVMGGGGGMGRLAEIVPALAGALAGQSAQIVVICGRNADLQRQLDARPWPLPVRVLGFVSNVPQWMAAADCLVSKAGPGTIAEALASGLPILLSDYVPGQETGNVAYVVDHGAGAFSREPAAIGEIIQGWLAPGNPMLAAMQGQARQLARPQAALGIAQALSELL